MAQNKGIRNTHLLPPNEEGKVLFQSNRITNGKWRGLTTIQSRILVVILSQLQDAILMSMKGVEFSQQLALFTEQNDGLLQIGVPLREICRPDQYKYIHSQADELMSVKLYLKSGEGTEKYNTIINVFHRFDIPELENGIKVMKVYLNKDSARKLIEVERNQNGVPINYTKYLKKVGLTAKNKYTYKLYMIIASWRAKGGFRISLNELREQLGIGEGQYKLFADFKRYVLLPVQEELKKNADCWFNCAEKGFFEEDQRTGKVLYINFKVITKKVSEQNAEYADHVRHLLKTHAGFKEEQMSNIQYLFHESTDYEQLTLRVAELLTYVRDPQNQVKNPVGYIIQSLYNEFNRQ